MEKDMKMPDEIFVVDGQTWWEYADPKAYRSTRYVLANLAPQQVDVEKLKREVHEKCPKGFYKTKCEVIDHLASRNLLANNPQAAPKCKRCDDTGSWEGGADGGEYYPCDHSDKAPDAPWKAAPDNAGARKFQLGDKVEKIKGSSWRGAVVGFYSTELTPIGYAVESENEPGSVQIYPEAALAKQGDKT